MELLPTLMLGRQRQLSVFYIIQVLVTKLVKFTTELLPWTGWSKSKNVVSQSPLQQLHANGLFQLNKESQLTEPKDITSISLIPLVTLTLLLRSIVLFVFSMDLSSCFQQLMVLSHNLKPTGDWLTTIKFQEWALSIKWIVREPISSMFVRKFEKCSNPMQCRSYCQ